MTNVHSDPRRIFLDIDSLTQWDTGLVQRFPQAEKITLNGLEAGPSGSCDARMTCAGSVLLEKDLWRMWYAGMPEAEDYNENADHLLNCYAESDDGITWRKPNLGLVGNNRYPGNNLLPLPGCGQIVESLPGSDFQYLAACVQIAPLEPDVCDTDDFEYHGPGTYLFASDDGFRWRQLTLHPLLQHGDVLCLTVDPMSNRYLLYHKLGCNHGLCARRSFVGLESTDGIHWEGYEGIRKWRECFVADDYDDAIAQQRGFLISEYYGISVYRTGEVYVSVENIFTVGSPLVPRFAQNPNGLCHFRLGFSHDGMHWRHPKGRPAWLELGAPGELDAGFMTACNAFVEHKDDLFLYYSGSRYDHGWCLNPDFSMKRDIPLTEQRDSCRIMLAKIKRDRFASLAASYKGMFDVDEGFRRGQELLINTRCPTGSIRVAIAEKSGPLHGELRKSDSLPGFSFEDCIPFTGDSISVPVRFRKAHVADIPSDLPISLRFEIAKGEIFGYAWST